MHWIDGHLDLAYLALRGRDLRVPCDGPCGCVSLPALRQAGIEVALATIFVEPGPCDLAAAGRAQLAVYHDLEARGEVSIVRSRSDLDRPGPLPRLVILMEGADPIDGPRDLMRWHEGGLRAVGLTWAKGNRYAGGNGAPGPLTAAGRELVAALDDAGIIHDASHLPDAALDELLGIARGPLVATHSNCRAITGLDQRHLRDEHIAAIGERGGVVGLNLYSRFLALGRRATIADCVAQLKHVASVMKHRRGAGLGSDADGGFPATELPEGLDHPAKLPSLAAALATAGWSATDLDGFTHANWHRLLKHALPP